jgi:hypothetical protein
LDHPELEAKRRAAIQGALNPKGRMLGLAQARKLEERLGNLERELDAGQPVILPAFVFAIRPCVAKEVRKLEGIIRSKSTRPKKAKSKKPKK